MRHSASFGLLACLHPAVRASVNWMYAAKMKSEGVAMYDAATCLK
jgi:hypothetical protein